MKTVVFVDELLLVNFAAAAALLLGARAFMRAQLHRAAAVRGQRGGCASAPLSCWPPPWPAPLAVLYKISQLLRSGGGVLRRARGAQLCPAVRVVRGAERRCCAARWCCPGCRPTT